MHRIRFARGALDDPQRLRARDRGCVVDEIQRRLTHQPQEPGRNRKELAGLVPPWKQVIVRAIRRKRRSLTKEIL